MDLQCTHFIKASLMELNLAGYLALLDILMFIGVFVGSSLTWFLMMRKPSGKPSKLISWSNLGVVPNFLGTNVGNI